MRAILPSVPPGSETLAAATPIEADPLTQAAASG
jgi:hypothetical protein